jgi:hypothetical protein
MLPYLDLAGFQRRTVMPAGDVGIVETAQPGYTAQRISTWQSKINARLRKRYGKVLPLGQSAPALVAVGNLPPAVALSGRPVLGSASYIINVTTGGALGTAVISYSIDGGVTYVTGVLTATSVSLGTSGLVATFSPGTYDVTNSYSSATAVPEAVLEWLTALVTVDLYRKRGVNPQDPTIVMVREDAERALAELKEAADSEMGLFDLPLSDDVGSAIDTGGPKGYSEQSPYKWTDKEARAGSAEDARELGIDAFDSGDDIV